MNRFARRAGVLLLALLILAYLIFQISRGFTQSHVTEVALSYVAADSAPAPAHREGVDWCVEHGILTGDAGGDLMLTQPVTRQQLCTMLYRFAKLAGLDSTETPDGKEG